MSADNNKPEKRPGKFGKLLNFIVSVFGVLIISIFLSIVQTKNPGTILTNKINIDGCTDHGDDNKSTIGSPISGFIHRFE
jgi:hypothetical protein